MKLAAAWKPSLLLLAGALLAWGCAPTDSGAGSQGGTSSGSGGRASGGSSGTGSAATGGSVPTGGSHASGGAAGSGGPGSFGGSSGSGGASATGGASSTGGASATSVAGAGGARASGGSSGAGGATGTGGRRDSGGASGGGGVPAMGGATGGRDAGPDGRPDTGTGNGGNGSGGNGTGGGSATGGTSGACPAPAPGSKGKNPLFTDVYTADPAPLVHDCTFYIACGHDEGSGTGFVLNNWFILKSTDMVSWTRIENALSISKLKWANANAWAAQIVARNGKFYWYVPVNKIGSCPNNCGMAIGVATADSPEGPYTDALGKPLIDDVFEMSNMGFTLDSDTPYTIDPTVYVDDDGQAYLHYGSFGRVVHVTLGADMTSVTGKMKEIDLGRISAADGKTSFFEAPFLTKRNGKWYEIYAAGANPAAINYSMADHPAGPWTAKGRILDPLPTTSTDGATNHAGVAELAGQWYIVYHISNGPNGGGTYHRMVAVDKLNFNADGTIQKVTPSSGLAF